MAVGDVYRVIVNQSFLGANVKNVYWYKQSGIGSDPTPAGPLLDEFSQAVWGTVTPFQNQLVVTNNYEALNYNSVVDFAVLVSNATGERLSSALSPFVAWAFKLNRSATTLRNGRKSYAGVSEDDQIDGQPDPGVTNLLIDHAAVLPEELVCADGSQFLPVIVRRPTTPLPVIPVNIVVAGAAFLRISTQNTRKV